MELQKGDHWDLVSVWLSGSISGEDRDRLFRWLEEDPARVDQLKALEKIWERSANYETPVFDLQAAWEKIQPKLGDGEQFRKRTLENLRERTFKKPPRKRLESLVFRKLFSGSLRVAASVVFLLLAGSLLYYFLKPTYSQVRVTTLPGETKSVTLPDDSRVVLNENSSLSYPENLDQAPERLVNLNGEAFFEVTKDAERTFVVRAGETETRVLGTSFNVWSDDASRQVRISLLSGKVHFVPPGKVPPVVLVPGEEAIYHAGDESIIKRQFKNKNFLSWKNQQLEFNDEPLEDVLAAVGKHYGITFHINDPQLNKLRVTSSFDHDSVDKVLQVLETLLDIRIERQENSYVVEAN